MDRFWLALGFLTTLPARAVAYAPDGLGKAAAWFPLVGLLLGLLLTALHAAALGLFGPLPAAVLVVAAWAGLTGGLHLDGLADCCDGLLAPVSRERRLEILRDPRVGSFGVTGLVLALLAKVAALYALAVGPVTEPAASLLPGPLPAFPPALLLALLLAPTSARWWILVAARQPAARAGGLGSSFAAALTPLTLARAAMLPLLLLGGAVWLDWRSLLGVALGGLACFFVLRLARARIGGVTGDVYGAVVELAEIACLFGLTQA
jgi:adenosylcobinamide-GDP ribazoletransferase